MAVSEQIPYKEYTANGVAKTFPLDFDCTEQDHLIVLVNDLVPSVGSWSLDTINDMVTFILPPGTGSKITIQRDTPLERERDYQTYDNSIRPIPLNKDFDLIWWKLQELGYRDQVIWLKLIKEISDRIAGDENLQDQIDLIDQQVLENTSDITQLINDLSNEIADRITGDQVLKDMFLSMIDEAINEGTINALAVIYCESIDQLKNFKMWDGRTIQVNSVNPPVYGTSYPYIGGGAFRFSTESNKVADGFLVVDAIGGKWIKLDIANATVDDFGAIGDGVTGDADAFIAYCNSPYTAINIILADRQAEYLIQKQVDCKLKGIKGHGFSKQNETYYKHSSIRVDGANAAAFANATASFDKKAFINVGAEVRDLQLSSKNASLVDGLQVNGYNTTISNINLSGFRYQIYVHGATVSFRVSDLMSISAAEAGVYVFDVNSDESTTAYFERCSWQWGKKPVHFNKTVFGCSFRDIIIEFMQEGLTAQSWSSTVFDTIWAESQTGTGGTPWLVSTASQQIWNCTYSNLYIRTPWLNPADIEMIANAGNTGGLVMTNSAIAVNSQTGGKIVFNVQGLKTRFAPWFSGVGRALRITTQPTDATSTYKTPLKIDAPNGELYFGNEDTTSNTPVVFKRLIGVTLANIAYYAFDIYTKTSRKWSTFNHESNNIGYFQAPLFLTYRSRLGTSQQNNAGWTITREGVGVFVVSATAGNTTVLNSPHVIVGGITTSNVTGTGGVVNHSLQFVDTYSGSWSTYSIAGSFKIFFRDQGGVAIDPTNFTVAMTLSV